jgi:cobalt/nickel transport system permease protein
MTLFAVHIGNNVLTWRWELGGFALAAVMLVIGAWRLQQDEIPRVALLTAAFFVASSIHVRLPGTSVHLILNGLVGVMLGWRSALAIFVGLVLQAVLIGHGGYFVLGVNTCIMTAPALLAWLLFRLLHRVSWTRKPVARALLVGLSAALWFLSGVAAVSLVWLYFTRETTRDAGENAAQVLLHPATLLGAFVFAVLAAWCERRMEQAPEFPLALFVGVLTVLLTVACSSALLIAGGAEEFGPAPLVYALVHLPIAAIEGVVLGFTVGFLAKVEPELLGSKSLATPLQKS